MHILDHVVLVKYRYSSRYESWMEMLQFLGLHKHCMLGFSRNPDV